ncbi:MAG: nucleotidyltransferase domain-containing protein [Bacteroidales bacterium]|nr:nucleotidyltransferase domain-containing protein [Bacteroidales bacterium]
MDVLQNIKDTLHLRLGETDKAYLYGSRARGMANANSDWDVLIVLDKYKITTEDYDEISYPLMALGWDLDQVISPMMYTKHDWEKSSFTPFYKNVQHDAIPLL